MKVSIFNPEHDMALADGSPSYTPPKIIQRMRDELSWLPCLWAAESPDIDVWGWDAAVKHELLRRGVDERLLPTDDFIANVRRLSSRRAAVRALQWMRGQGLDWLCGESWWCDDADKLPSPLTGHVLKSPWSSSGRGLMFFHSGIATPQQMSWVRNVIERQGGIAVERICNKQHDCALEYTIADGAVVFNGLSVFGCSPTGAYSGNLLDTLPNKLRSLGLTHNQLDVLVDLHTRFLSVEIAPFYSGPVGIDMMVCADCRVNPCVEINLRRTMGHVALAIERSSTPLPAFFVVGYDKAKGYFAEVRTAAHGQP